MTNKLIRQSCGAGNLASMKIAFGVFFVLLPRMSFSQQLGPRETVEKMFAEDFSPQTWNLPGKLNSVVYSQERVRIEKKENPEFSDACPACHNEIGDTTASRLFVVSTYVVVSENVFVSSANVEVIFDRLARTHGYGVRKRRLIQDIRGRDVVTYDLRLVGGRWLIYDPPLPRVCIAAMIRSFEELGDGEWETKELRLLKNIQLKIGSRKKRGG
jgi:hypothetical protein